MLVVMGKERAYVSSLSHAGFSMPLISLGPCIVRAYFHVELQRFI